MHQLFVPMLLHPRDKQMVHYLSFDPALQVAVGYGGGHYPVIKTYPSFASYLQIVWTQIKLKECREV